MDIFSLIFSLPFFIGYLIVALRLAPTFARSLDRGVLDQCPEGATKKFCNTYHSKECRMSEGIKENATVDAVAAGLALGFVFPLTFIWLYVKKKASAPDAVALEKRKAYDKEAFRKVEAHQRHLQEIEEGKLNKALEAAERDHERRLAIHQKKADLDALTEVVSDEDVEVVPDEPDMREPFASITASDFKAMKEHDANENVRWDDEQGTWVPERFRF